jgi:hypothetical protein
MILFLVLAVLLPWSISRQMHVHTISRRSFIKLPAMVGMVFVTLRLSFAIQNLVVARRSVAGALTPSIAVG